MWSDLDTNGSRGLAVPRICKLCSTGRDERRESKAHAKTAVHAKTVRSTKTLRRKTSSLTQAANFSVLTASRSAVWQRQGEMESTEQARSSSTSGGLPRPEPGYCQPTPPYKTGAQFFDECSDVFSWRTRERPQQSYGLRIYTACQRFVSELRIENI